MTDAAAEPTLSGAPAAEHIPPEYRAGVAAQFAMLAAQARLVESFPLPDETEPGPVYTP